MDPPPQTLDELEEALHREWRHLTIHQIRRLTGGMRRRVEAITVHVAGSPIIEQMWYKFYLETQSDIFIKKL